MMKVLIKYILLIALTEMIASCAQSNKSDNIREKLIGSWVLDSVSTLSGKYQKANDTKVFNFKNGSDYSSEWMNGDVGGEERGIYTISINPRRSVATISFIPDVEISGKDTIRMIYSNFDVIELGSDRLHTVDQTIFIDRENMPSIIFNKHCIYKRSK